MSTEIQPFDFSGQPAAEEWRPIVGLEGYLVSNTGRVRSARRGSVRDLTLAPDSEGYLRVQLAIAPGRSRRFGVHRLVAEAWHGACPDGMECRHLNGDPTDNRAVNLAWGSRSENVLDSVEHGTHAQASRQHCPAQHRYDEENTYVSSDGRRHCRPCRKERTRAYRRRMAKIALPADEAARQLATAGA